MLLNINATRPLFFMILNQNEFCIATVAMFTWDLYAGSPPPHDLKRLRTTMQRRVVDFVRVGYFIPLNGPMNGHPPSFNYQDILQIAASCLSIFASECFPSSECCALSKYNV